MEHGNYLVRQPAVPGSKYRLTVSNKGLRLFDVDGNKLIKPIDKSLIGSIYVVEKKLRAVTSKWDLEYWIGGRCKEIVVSNVDFGVIKWTRQHCKTTHAAGMLIPVRHKEAYS